MHGVGWGGLFYRVKVPICAYKILNRSQQQKSKNFYIKKSKMSLNGQYVAGIVCPLLLNANKVGDM